MQTRLAALLSHTVESDIAIIEIDARSIDALGRWPWLRSTYALAVDRLSQLDIHQLFIDVDFSAESIAQEDAILWQSLSQFSRDNTLMLPAFLQYASAIDNQLIFRSVDLEKSPSAQRVSVNLRPDSDGLVREALSGFDFEHTFYPLAASVLADKLGRETLIDFSLSPSSFTYVSFIDVLDPQYDLSVLAGKRVLLGATSVELGDNIPVPIYGSLPGVVVQALIAETHQKGGLQPVTTSFEHAILFVLWLVSCLFVLRSSWLKGLIYLSLGFVCILMVAVVSHHIFRVQTPIAYPFVFIVINYVAILILKIDAGVIEKIRLKLLLRDKEAFLNALLTTSNDYILCDDDSGSITHASNSLLFLLACKEKDILGQRVKHFMPATERLDFNEVIKPIDVELNVNEALSIPVALSVNPIDIRSKNAYTLVIRDLRKRIQREEALRHQALHDDLTGLPNRAYLFEYLDGMIMQDKIFNVLILGLSQFKLINDYYGHAKGDEILIETATRIKNSIGELGKCFRLESDEFFVVFNTALPERETEDFVKKLVERLHHPFRIEDNEVELNVSIGIVNSTQEEIGKTALIRYADLALQRAKRSDKTYAWYDSEVDDIGIHHVKLVSELHEAIVNDDLYIVFQPKIDLLTKQVVGVEVLCRWRRVDGVSIGPNIFIEAAENSRLIGPLTNWVLQATLKAEANWRRHGLPEHMAINLSAKLLGDSVFIEGLKKQVKQSLGYFSIEFEITESAIMGNRTQALSSIQMLRDNGYDIAIDDYGTGYSSLAYLHELGAATLKIDKQFIDNIVTDVDSQVIVRSTISMAHELGMKVVSEGIEDEEQAKILNGFHCDIGQGYVFGRPMTQEQFVQWYLEWQQGLGAGLDDETDRH